MLKRRSLFERCVTLPVGTWSVARKQTIRSIGDHVHNLTTSYFNSKVQAKRKYTFSPAELSSERGEKELADSKQPTAPPSTKSHVSYCAARARRREKMAAEGTSSTTGRSLLQSVLVSAVDSCHPSQHSTALLPIAPPPPPSLSDQVWCIQRCDCVNWGYSQNGAGRDLRGTFSHGSMLDVWLVAWGREKLTFGELLFASFAWIRLGWYLQTTSVFEELEKSSQRKS